VTCAYFVRLWSKERTLMARLARCPIFAKSRHFDGSGKGAAVELSIRSSPAPAGMPLSVKLPSVAVQRRWGNS